MTSLVSLLEEYTEKGDILQTLADYDRSPAARLFRRVIKETAGSQNSLAGFNNWVENILPQQISKRDFISESGVSVTFSDVFLAKPIRVKDNKEIPLYPQYCREYHFPYTGKLEVTCTTQKGKEKRTIRVTLGQVPIMLGSIKCNLYGKSPEELVELGECITDPFGYFIVSSEWVLITHDKKRHNLPMIGYDKKNARTYLSNQYCINKFLQLRLGKEWGSIELADPLNNREEANSTFPIFIIYKIITGLEPNEVIDKYILRFIDPKYHRRTRNELSYSVFDYNSIPDPVLFVYSIRNEYKVIKEDNKKKLISDIKNNLEKEIFITIDDENDEIRKEKKIILLSYMVARFVLYKINIIPMDNPDSWMNKRFDNSHNHMEALFYQIFNSVLNKCKHKKGSKDMTDNFINFGDYLNSRSKEEFKKNFEASFNTTNWGVKDINFNRENYRETLRRDTPVALWSQIVKNTNNISQKGVIISVREIQPSQRNKHCIMETPEGQQVGIVKYNCLTGIFSLRRDDKKINEYITRYGSSYEAEKTNVLVLVNGMPRSDDNSVLYVSESFRDVMIEARRMQNIPFDTEIVFNSNLNILDIFIDSSRAITPYLIVNPKTNELVIEEKKAWDLDYQTLLSNGCIEFLGAREEDDENIVIASSVDKFYANKKIISTANEEMAKVYKIIYKYSHCSVDAMQMFSLATSTCPLSNHQMAPRTTYQASMVKQALGYYNINYHLRYDKKFKQLYKAERSLTETDSYFLPMMDLFPSGQIANVAFLCDADNQEDSVLVSEDYINAGHFNFVRYQVFDVVIPTNTKGYTIQFKIPPLKKNEDPRIYRHLQENGLPKLDSLIEPRDCLLGQVAITSEGETNQSHFAELDIQGYIDRVLITRDRNGRNPIIRIKIRSHNKYQAGDKLALRYAQKGTVGRVAKREELPVVSSGPNKGITPDVIFNPHGFPSRQTAGLLIEGLISKAALYDGKRRDVSAFRKNDLQEAMKVLEENDLDPHGYEDMETSSGEPLKDKVCLVPLYEQALKHHVDEKFQYRNTGSRDFVTHQPRSGRSKGGGLRVGEMEKDSFAAHGASAVIRERMMKSSDEFKLIVCHNCGVIINYKFCTVCNNSDPVIVLIPYVFKVLIRLLAGVGIDIRLKTRKLRSLKN